MQSDTLLVNEDLNPLVKNLMIWRHTVVAHRAPGPLLRDVALGERYPLTFSDVGLLLDNGLGIVNRYSILFIAQSNLKTMVGHDDFLKLLEAVRADLTARETNLEAEVAQSR